MFIKNAVVLPISSSRGRPSGAVNNTLMTITRSQIVNNLNAARNLATEQISLTFQNLRS
jgi:hypothetical protein